VTGQRLDGKVAFVTGAGSGIGRAIATALHAEGAAVVIADVSGNEKALADELGARTVAVTADVTVGSDVAAAVDAAREAFGGLHVMVNNAGIDGAMAPIVDCSEENFDRVVAVNLKGVFLGMKHAIPLLLASGGGSVINIASAAGLVGFPMMPAYCASKGGVVQLTRAGALEYAAAGVRVNAICPGVIDTPLIAGIDPAMTEAAMAMTPLGRLGRPSEIAALAVFLASDESSYMTGAALSIDGGFTTH
jgi:NAD(P)-dependent dehydrogenase (short-subunit alcohol dehydrogenase family)